MRCLTYRAWQHSSNNLWNGIFQFEMNSAAVSANMMSIDENKKAAEMNMMSIGMNSEAIMTNMSSI